MTESEHSEEYKQLEQAVAALKAQRAILGDAVVEAALGPMRRQLAELEEAERKPAPVFEGERKLVTVMFADISGFTALSEKLDPEAVRELMNACFDRLVPVVEKYEGTVDKFIGDEIMAVFGAPVAHENDPERALRTALEMMDALAAFNADHDINLGMHIGINTGLVIAGGIGSEGRQQYSVMGDAVNLAARLGDASERGEIFVGPDTHRLTAPLFEFEPLEPIRVKGKAEPVAAHRLLATRAVRGKVRGIEGLRSVMVGRDAELRQLQAAIRVLQKGQGSVIAIFAEAGLGKSRLVAEARQVSPAQVTWVEGRAFSYTQGISYWIARDVLRGLLGVEVNAPLKEISAALRSSIESILPERGSEDVWPYLAHLLDLPLDQVVASRIARFGLQTLQERILRAFCCYVRARSQQPLVLMWEDMHWADISSLNLLGSLLNLTDEVPLLFLLVFRPEKGAAWDFHQRVSETCAEKYQAIELHPLTRDHSASLVQSLLKIENLSDQTCTLILDKAEGNPLFLEELFRSLIEAGMVLLQEGRVIGTDTIHGLKAIDVPDTVQGVIAARIDRLPANDKYTLQTAAVIGRVFQRQVLKYLLDQEQASVHLDVSLDELRRHEFVRLREALAGQRVSEDPEYIFKHVLTQETAYNSLLIVQRKALHRMAGEAIEAFFPERLDELAATLAHHFERAEVPDKAIAFLRQAGNRAAQLSAYEEAIAHFARGLELLKTLPDTPERPEQELALQMSWALSLMNLKGYSDTEAGQACTRARELCEQIGEASKITTVLGLLSAHHFARADYGRALELAEQLLCVALKKKKKVRLSLVVGNYLQAVIYLGMGELGKGLKHAEQAIANYSPHLDRVAIQEGGVNAGVGSRCFAASILQLSGYSDQSRQRLDEATALTQDDPYNLAYALFYSALVSKLQRDVQKVQGHTRELVTLATEYGFQMFRSFGIIFQGWTMAMHGRAAEGLVHVRRGLAIQRAKSTETYRSFLLCLLAEVCNEAGQIEQGLAALNDGIAFVERTGERFCEAEIHRLRGELLLKVEGETMKNELSPEACFLKAIEVARQQNARLWELRATTSLCRLWGMQDKREEARQMLEEIYSWFTEGFSTADLQEAKTLLGELAYS